MKLRPLAVLGILAVLAGIAWSTWSVVREHRYVIDFTGEPGAKMKFAYTVERSTGEFEGASERIVAVPFSFTTVGKSLEYTHSGLVGWTEHRMYIDGELVGFGTTTATGGGGGTEDGSGPSWFTLLVVNGGILLLVGGLLTFAVRRERRRRAVADDPVT